jgi:hypothetical protein
MWVVQPLGNFLLVNSKCTLQCVGINSCIPLFSLKWAQCSALSVARAGRTLQVWAGGRGWVWEHWAKPTRQWYLLTWNMSFEVPACTSTGILMTQLCHRSLALLSALQEWPPAYPKSRPMWAWPDQQWWTIPSPVTCESFPRCSSLAILCKPRVAHNKLLVWVFAVLGTEPRASYMLDKYSSATSLLYRVTTRGWEKIRHKRDYMAGFKDEQAEAR